SLHDALPISPTADRQAMEEGGKPRAASARTASVEASASLAGCINRFALAIDTESLVQRGSMRLGSCRGDIKHAAYGLDGVTLGKKRKYLILPWRDIQQLCAFSHIHDASRLSGNGSGGGMARNVCTGRAGRHPDGSRGACCTLFRVGEGSRSAGSDGRWLLSGEAFSSCQTQTD